MEMKRILFVLVALLLLATAGTMAQTTHTVKIKEGTADAEKWTIDPNPATAGQKVVVTYSGNKKVKSVRARKKVEVTSITLEETTAKLAVGKTYGLWVKKVIPDNAPDKTYTWSSDNTAVAIVDQAGLVTGISPGIAHIRATANDGSGTYGECVCEVVKSIILVLGGETIDECLEYVYEYDGKEHGVLAYWNGYEFDYCYCDSGHHYNYGNDGARASVNGTIISLGVSNNWDSEGFWVEFDTSNYTYRIIRNNNNNLPEDIISVKVDDVEIKDKLTKQQEQEEEEHHH